MNIFKRIYHAISELYIGFWWTVASILLVIHNVLLDIIYIFCPTVSRTVKNIQIKKKE
jgi:hypothetical protein